MEDRRITQQDIAREAGVHRATVSMAFKQHPSIPVATRQRILAIAEKLGYTPDPMLAALAAYRSRLKPITFQGTLAWLTNSAFGYDWRTRPHLREFFKGAQQRAERFGFQVEHFELNAPQMTPERMASILRARNVQGILLCPQPRPDTRLNFPLENFSAVTFGYSLIEPALHSVSATHYRSVVQTVRQLRELGYQRIGLALEADHDQRTDHNYLAGYLVETHLHPEFATIPPLLAPYSEPAALKAWIREHKLDAVITGNYQILSVLETLGISVPDDLGVACPVLPTDDDMVAGVREQSLQVGQVAVDTLVAMIQRGERGTPSIPQRIHVEGKWVAGRTLRNMHLQATARPRRVRSAAGR